ncbi:MAG: hypothetical protein JOY54_06525 [Acidobacteriaceae bacterium]|nr:hypothetical protein [Acidobacteriaceae bacterium]
MDQNTLLIVLIIFVATAACALLIQAVSLFGLLVVARDFRKKLMPLLPQIEDIIGRVHQMTERSEKHLDRIASTSIEILDISKQQLVKVDELLTDASVRAKVQMERAEMVIDDTMTRVQETVGLMQRGVLRPIREVHGLLAGVKTALQYIGRGSRATVDHATADEEMFI